MTGSLQIRPAIGSERAKIASLLEDCGLPFTDLDESRPEFLVATEDDELRGVIGLQNFGDVALLRSLAVAPAARNSGVGARLVDRLEGDSKTAGVRKLVLLTQTAEKFFVLRGYRSIERAALPERILATTEFRSLCPASAACLAKSL